jgi:DNA polymerase I-like protein with 3'-5' exonuclease and polymerase domains
VSTVSPNGKARFSRGVEILTPLWSEGRRHKLAGPLAGGLLRAGWTVEDVGHLFEAVAEAAVDDEVENRLAVVQDTADKLKAQKPVTGWPTLAKLVGRDGDAVVSQLRHALGLTITLAELAADKGLPIEFLQGLGLHDLGHGGVGIPYRRRDGREPIIKRRTALAANNGSWWPNKTPLQAYGEDRLDDALAAGFLVLVEGESDCWTLWRHEIPGLGLPGSDTVKATLELGHVAKVPVVYVVQEPDPSGEAFVAAVTDRLAAVGWGGALKVVRFGPSAGAKDPNELHKQGADQFRGRFQRLLDGAEPVQVEAKPPPKSPRLRQPDPYRPFPTEWLPEPVRTYVRQEAEALGCDPAFVALHVLAVLASLIGNTRTIRIKKGWTEPAVIWAAVVADSGTIKSPAFDKALAHLHKLQRRLLKEYKQQLEEYEEAKPTYDAEVRQRRKKNQSTDDLEKPRPPVCKRFFANDITIERLAEMLEDNPRGLLVARDELSAWIGSFLRYKGRGANSDLPHWLEMHRAKPFCMDRKTGDRRTIYVRHAGVSVAGTIQPGVFAEALTAEYQEAGLGPRLILAMPPKKPKRWTEAEVAPEVQKAYEDTLDKLAALEFDTDDEGDPAPFALRMTPAAKAMYVAFYNEWAVVQAAADGVLASAFSKLEAYCTRFALIHHVVTRVGTGPAPDPLEPPPDASDPVDVDSIRAGIELARWFAYEARRVYATLNETKEERDARRLIEFIRARGGSITPRQLCRSNPSRYRGPEQAEEALDALVQAGLADWQDRPPGARGGRPTKALVLRPAPPKPDKPAEDDADEDGPGDGGAPTKPPDKTPPAGGESRENEGSVGFRRREPEEPGPAHPGQDRSAGGEGFCQAPPEVSLAPGDKEPPAAPTESEPDGGGCSRDGRVGTAPPKPDETPAPAYTLITEPSELPALLQALDESQLVGVDTETTGLNPRTDRVRLLSVATDRGVYLVDCFAVPAGDLAPVFDLLAERPVVMHNGLFDLSMLRALGFVPGPVRDTMLMSLLLDGPRKAKGFHGLEECARRELGLTLDKTLQKSDWSGVLSAEQLAYAARDPVATLRLYAAFEHKVRDAGLERVADIESRCLPAMAWLATAGAPLDRTAWETLATESEEEAHRLWGELDASAPPPPARRQGMFGGWNWRSDAQVKQAFAELGVKLEKTDDDVLAEVSQPLAGLLRRFRAADKRAGTYGKKFLQCLGGDGRLYCEWRQLGCVTGRMASRSPNLQNLPADPRYRRCFAAPPGRVLIKADYSQIELRITAKVTGDRQMMAAYRDGLDLHTLTARQILGRQEVTKEDRKLAKPINFGLIYGLGARSLQRKASSEYGVAMTLGQAKGYAAAFFDHYAGVRAWHDGLKRRRTRETRTLAGRRCLVEADFWYGGRANYIVQGTGGDGIKQALVLLWERREQCPGAFPVLVVHDEIVVECGEGQAETAVAWLRQAMLDAMAPLIAPVPVEVEVAVGRTWGGD